MIITGNLSSPRSVRNEFNKTVAIGYFGTYPSLSWEHARYCKRRHKMTTTKNESSRRNKLLVPVVALVLCAAAMIGVGYAALMSDVTNSGNVINTDGYTVKFDGTAASTAGGFGSMQIDYGSHTNLGVTTYYFDAITGKTMGASNLVIDASNTSVTNVTIGYVVTYSTDNGTTYTTTAPYGITTSLAITPTTGTTVTTSPITSGTTAATITPGAATNTFGLALTGTISATTGMTTVPADFLYQIVVTVTPVS